MAEEKVKILEESLSVLREQIGQLTQVMASSHESRQGNRLDGRASPVSQRLATVERRRTERPGEGMSRDRRTPEYHQGETSPKMMGRSIASSGEVEIGRPSGMTSPAQGPPSPLKYRPLAVPKYAKGGDWRCFVAEFREMVKVAQLNPAQQLIYLRQAVPDEVKGILSLKSIETVDQALGALTQIYEPSKDAWAIMQELDGITQRPGERLLMLALIEEVVRRYGEAVNSASRAELDRLTQSRFRHALADEDTRNFLIWDECNLTLDEMVKKAQAFEDVKNQSNPLNVSHKLDDIETEVQGLKRQLAELQQLVETLSRPHPTTVEGRRPRCRPSPVCWNCGGRGHFSRECSQQIQGDGMKYRKERRVQGRQAKRLPQKQPALNQRLQGAVGHPPWM